MEHSLCSYLKRRSTDELTGMLKYYLKHSAPNPYLEAAALILNELREREHDMPVELTPEIQRCWQKYLAAVKESL